MCAWPMFYSSDRMLNDAPLRFVHQARDGGTFLNSWSGKFYSRLAQSVELLLRVAVCEYAPLHASTSLCGPLFSRLAAVMWRG